jgi:1-acyl-sn-glycerol-3-phosphate acyltransferase
MDFSIRFGKSPYLTLHKPLAVSDFDFAELMEKTETQVVKGIKF